LEKRLVGCKCRLYPTEEQKTFFAKHFGGCRFIYNYLLHLRKIAYKRWGKWFSFYRLKKHIAKLKKRKEFSFLKELNSQSLQESFLDQEKGFKRFFKKISNYPRFKKKSHKQSFKIPQNAFLRKTRRGNLYLIIPKLKSAIKIKVHRNIVGKIKQVTIIKEASGKYYASLNYETEEIIPVKEAVRKDGAIDLGLTAFFTKDNSEKVYAPKPLKKLLKKLVAAHKSFSRKIPGRNNWNKARIKIAKIYETITDIRKDFLHKESLKLVIENQVTYIEDLHVKGLMRNRCLSRAFADVSHGRFTIMLNYKALWRGREVCKIDRFAPTSKMCSECGYINEELKLGDRTWDCKCCNNTHDRDVNAAKNILKVGREMSLGMGKPDVKSVEISTYTFSLKQRKQVGSVKQKAVLKCKA
jgi:putative transposase